MESGMAKLSQEDAEKKLTDAGITWSSSGECSDRNKTNCTSFDQINEATIDGIIAFKNACKGTIVITGGTEKGHETGTNSHWNGYKVDIRFNPTVDQYIKAHYTKMKKRADGAEQYKSKAGNIYALEASHWDITYF